MSADRRNKPQPLAGLDAVEVAVASGDPERPADAEITARADQAIEFLEAARDDFGMLAALDPAVRQRLLTAAGQVARPGPWAKRELAKEARRRRRAEKKAADEEVLARTGIREKRAQPVFATPMFAPVPAALGGEVPDEVPGEVPAGARPAPVGDVPAPSGHGEPRRVEDPRNCYVCKRDYRDIHFFYDAMCPPCAELNWRKRTQTADLRGRVALVTGARVKIGYQAAIKLLRAGARVIVTTRFPRDAAARYAREADFADWQDRLDIYGLDLRHTPSVEALARHLEAALPRLDFVLNNACQTVRRPAGFYDHLLAAEARALDELAPAERQLVAGYEDMRTRAAAGRAASRGALVAAASAVGLRDPAQLSQLALLEEDLDRSTHLFPTGQLDADLQQVDLRATNSWRLGLAEVPAVELLEVQLVNAVAPFVLNARLKGLMTRVPTRDKHIVNVSAMEGQFYRRFKTDRHPHTNMAKAALNMMTRTSAADYIADGIHMNSVDTGWVTDEDPAELARRKVEVHGFHPPLDIVDGAARICDPIFAGFATGEHVWGLFLKDYAPTDW